MKAILKDGPADGQEAYVSPGQLYYITSVAKPLSIIPPKDPFESTYTAHYYRFSGLGIVDMRGNCSALVYVFDGSYDG